MSRELYLSRVRLRPDPDVQTLVPLLLPADRDERFHAAHRLLWSLFADSPDRKRDFQWREDADNRFFVLSSRPPEDHNRLFFVETKVFSPVLRPGDRLAFVLRANPVVQRRTPEGRARRDDIVMAALHALEPDARAEERQHLVHETGSRWLARQGEANGFALPATPKVDGYRSNRIARSAGTGTMVFSTLDFEGVLEVTEPARFLERVGKGFGRARAFGCGLMLVKRV
jgi:CRISPR system Cascade subunit CasE